MDAELLELKTNLERNLQIMEKQDAMMAEYHENLLYAELDKRDVTKKVLTEKEVLLRAQEKERERNAVLAVQLELKEKKKQAEKAKDEKEKTMLREEWARERENAQLLKNARSVQGKVMAEQILRTNEEQRAEKERVLAAEKLADKEMIDRIIAKEKELLQMEKEMKEQQKEENRKFLLNFKSRANELSKYEKELDRLIEEERARQEAKKLEEWQRQEEARIKLLRDVYADREQKVYHNLAQKDAEKQVKTLDRTAVDDRVAREEEESQFKRQERERKRKL